MQEIKAGKWCVKINRQITVKTGSYRREIKAGKWRVKSGALRAHLSVKCCHSPSTQLTLFVSESSEKRKPMSHVKAPDASSKLPNEYCTWGGNRHSYSVNGKVLHIHVDTGKFNAFNKITATTGTCPKALLHIETYI